MAPGDTQCYVCSILHLFTLVLKGFTCPAITVATVILWALDRVRGTGAPVGQRLHGSTVVLRLQLYSFSVICDL